MTTAVKIHYYSTLITFPVAGGSGRYSTDSVMATKLPPLGREALTVGTTASSTTIDVPNGARIAVIEVEPGKRVRFEANPPSRSVAADQDSPALFGTQHVECAEGWHYSFVETS